MKKLISILLVFVLALSLVACGEAAQPAQQAAAETTEGGSNFMAGFGMVNITPSDSVNMAGYGDHDTRLSDGYLSYLEARAVAIMDENGDTGQGTVLCPG